MSVRLHWSQVVMPCQESHRVAGMDCSFRDAWPPPWVVWACLSARVLAYLATPEPKSRLVRVVEGAWVPRVELACGRVGDDGDVMVAQLVRPTLRFLARRATCMAAGCCICMTWRFVPPHASVAMLEPCVWAYTPVGTGLVVWGGDLSYEAETCRAGRRLLVQGRDFPLVGNWSEMQPTGQRLDVLPVWVLTRVPSPPCPKSLSWHCQS
jgi:hypothetical protein